MQLRPTPQPKLRHPADRAFLWFVVGILSLLLLSAVIRDVTIHIKWRWEPDVYHWHHYDDGHIEKISGP